MMENASIVTIHGLGAHGEYTWTVKVPETDGNASDRLAITNPEPKDSAAKKYRRLNWLREFLCMDFPTARVMNFGHNADWFILAPVVASYETARTLLRQLKEKRVQNVYNDFLYLAKSS